MHLPFAVLFRLAWRNLWRNYRRTLIMLGAITVGVWAMIFMTAVMRGMVDDMLYRAVRNLPGHVQIHHSDYRDDPSISNSMPPIDQALLDALEQPEIIKWSARVRVPAVITSEHDTRGTTLLGIDPEEESGLSFIADSIVAGRFLESVDDRGLIVGQKMIDNLETVLGRRVVVMSQDPDNEIIDRGFRIVGVFATDLENVEESFIFTGRKTVQSMLNMGASISEIAVLGHDYRDVSDVLRLQEVTGPDREILPWYEIDTYLGTMLSTMDGFVLVWIVVVFLALSFGLVNTLVMAVFERVREIGLMQALGMRPSMIVVQVLMETFLLLLIGLAAGNLFAILSVVALSDGIDLSIVSEGMQMMGVANVLYPSLQTNDVLLADVVVIVLGLLAGLSPAWRAARYQPVEAITKV
ncbi:MAG: FtsX-like permease family protein [Arenicellales bacterium]|nr:FtsX-like permease family protein [Arenicellales bacterium]